MFPPDVDYKKRDYLLPLGCSNLTDMPRVEARRRRREAPPPPRVVNLGRDSTVRQLALHLHLGLFQVILDVIRISGFCSVSQIIPFDVAAEVARRHGIVPRFRG